MKQLEYKFSKKAVQYYLDADFETIENFVSTDKTIIICDKNVYQHHAEKFSPFKTIVIEPGENNKQQFTVDYIIHQLIELKADRSSFLLGIGGGVVTDITGFVASVYMRGIAFAFAPTTILSMVDAAIGGKNGIDVGMYKNLVGTIVQPQFIFYDFGFLKTLAQNEWENGFAEIIKHACIKDSTLFSLLEKNSLENFKNDNTLLLKLIEKNVRIKSKVVVDDEYEKGERRLLNFGHTLGHAIENNYQLMHGQAISIGMSAATKFSEAINGLEAAEKNKIIQLIKKYNLPVEFSFDKEKVFETLIMDKKREAGIVHYILLNKIGEAIIQPLTLQQVKELFNNHL